MRAHNTFPPTHTHMTGTAPAPDSNTTSPSPPIRAMNCVIQLHVLDGQPNQANDQIQTTTQVARSFALLQPLVDQGAPLHLNVGTRQGAYSID